MTYTLRDYQHEAVKRTLVHFRKSNLPAVVVLPTGAGKSLVIAELARLAKGRVLVLTHVKELVAQNYTKFTQLGCKAGIYSAGLKQKDLTEKVIFASIQSLSRNLAALTASFSLVVIDECHRVSEDEDSQYQQTLTHLKSTNPDVKILGLTATPYRLGLGWIYQYHYLGFARSDEARPFSHCVYELPLRYLIKQHYLTPPTLSNAAIDQYDFSAILPDAFGNLPEKPVNALLAQCQRVTHSIVQQIIELAAERNGVMIFAATVKHAEEILSYLPSTQSALIVGDTPSAERDLLIKAFKAQQLKYLVNVSVLTTGFDAPHVDLIAILRPTQSVSLYQQMIGRGLRLFPSKKDCLIIDYAGNRYDIFQPEVGSAKPDSDSVPVQVFCPACGFANTFWGKMDADGQLIEHFGRRCQAILGDEADETTESSNPPVRCDFRFRYKVCHSCGAENDIAARHCHQCQTAITDPDDQLKRALQLKDCKVMRCAGLTLTDQGTRLCVTYHDEDGDTVHEWFDFKRPQQKALFNRLFGRRFLQSTQPIEFANALQACAAQEGITAPDFVVASPYKKGWRIDARIFDYQGRYRKANAL